MNESNSIEAIDKTNLTNQVKFRLDIDQALIVLSATSGGVSITLFTSIVRAPVGIASASLTLLFSLTTGIVKKLLNITRKKERKKHE